MRHHGDDSGGGGMAFLGEFIMKVKNPRRKSVPGRFGVDSIKKRFYYGSIVTNIFTEKAA